MKGLYSALERHFIKYYQISGFLEKRTVANFFWNESGVTKFKITNWMN